MPKWGHNGPAGGRTAKPPRRHLYLVLDDWSSGYSIRKIDLLSDFDYDSGSMSSNGKQRLPSAIFRFEAQRGLPTYFTSAFESKIMVMHPVGSAIDGKVPLVPKRLITAFDVSMRSVMFCPRQNPDPDNPIYIPVSGKLFVLSTSSFQMLYPPPDDESWSNDRVWSWRQLPMPPFNPKYVTSYTVHPDGRTIFVSINRHGLATTFTFDTAESALTDDCMGTVDCMWKRQGKWMLPFRGRAYYDRALDAWVGLSGDLGTPGHLCACDVMSTSVAIDGQWPTLKHCELFSENPVLSYVGATLLYMGSRSKFCLVACIRIKDDYVGEMNDDSVGEMNDKLEKQHAPRHRGYLFCLKTFFLMYDKNGDLKTGEPCKVRWYGVPEKVSESICKYPVAFWM